MIPLRPGKKTPVRPSWGEFQARRATREEILDWGPANVGIVTGAVSGVVVIDCESLEDGRWFWRTHGKAGVVAVTPRGVHFYYRRPGGRVGNRAGVRDEAGRRRFDVRGDGGYVVAPPSRVTADGAGVKASGAYRFVDGYAMRDPRTLPAFDPAWARPEPPGLAFGGGSGRRAVRQVIPYVRKIRAVSGAGGHNATWVVVNRLRDAGYGEAETLLALQEWNRTNADPPWSDAELLHKVKDAYRPPARRAA